RVCLLVLPARSANLAVSRVFYATNFTYAYPGGCRPRTGPAPLYTRHRPVSKRRTALEILKLVSGFWAHGNGPDPPTAGRGRGCGKAGPGGAAVLLDKSGHAFGGAGRTFERPRRQARRAERGVPGASPRFPRTNRPRSPGEDWGRGGPDRGNRTP